MSSKKQQVQSFFNAAFQEGAFPSTNGFTLHLHTSKNLSSEAASGLVSRLKTVYSDFSFQIEDIIEEESRIAVRGKTFGTDIKSGKSFSAAAFGFVRFESNRIAEVWFMDDDGAIQEQVGK